MNSVHFFLVFLNIVQYRDSCIFSRKEALSYCNGDTLMAHHNATTSQSWNFFVWICFAIAILSMAVAVLYMPINGWLRAYLGLSALFLVQASISLSKTLRDQAEQEQHDTPL